MAPSARPRTRTTKTRRKPRRANCKNTNPPASSAREDLPSVNSSASSSDCSKIDGLDFEGVGVSTSACSTPKAERFRIPETVTCPPAPKKPRMAPNCSIQRTPIAFFAHPDLELFFFSALRNVSV